jgi:hypothetical protein
MLVEDNPVDLDLTLRAFKSQNIENPVVTAATAKKLLNISINGKKAIHFLWLSCST